MESMEQCVSRSGGVPQWYMMMEDGRIIGGVGVIENDFHDRKDLAPNVCALYVEEDFRCRGIAGVLLRFVCDDMADFGIDTLYLITDHTSFYERYGWSFYVWFRAMGNRNRRECMCIQLMKRGGTYDSENKNSRGPRP